MEAPPLERRLAVILAADVEGYNRLMHGDEVATMTMSLDDRALVGDLMAWYRDRIADTAVAAYSTNSKACSLQFAVRSASRHR
jgi:adenylate cyclase